MSKFKIFLIGFLVGMIFTASLVIINSSLNEPSAQTKNKYSDSHLICTYSKTNSNVLICKIKGE